MMGKYQRVWDTVEDAVDQEEQQLMREASTQLYQFYDDKWKQQNIRVRWHGLGRCGLQLGRAGQGHHLLDGARLQPLNVPASVLPSPATSHTNPQPPRPAMSPAMGQAQVQPALPMHAPML